METGLAFSAFVTNVCFLFRLAEYSVSSSVPRLGAGMIESVIRTESAASAPSEVGELGRFAGIGIHLRCLPSPSKASPTFRLCGPRRGRRAKFQSADGSPKSTSAAGGKSWATWTEAGTHSRESGAISAVAGTGDQESRDTTRTQAFDRSADSYHSAADPSARTRGLPEYEARGRSRDADGESHRLRATQSA